MRRHLRRWLDNAVLRELGDRYEGIIANVVERTLRNRFTCTRELQPVIEFEDGLRLVPNITMRRTLIEFFGADTEEWIGRRVVVYRHRVERTDPDSGKVLERFEKRAMRPEADVAVMTARRRERHLRAANTEASDTPVAQAEPPGITADEIPWAGRSGGNR